MRSTTPRTEPIRSELFRLDGAVRRSPVVDDWLTAQPGELGALARIWFETLRGLGADVREVMHDGYATVCVDDAAFAYVGVFKQHINIGLFRGASLPDPAGLLQGTGKTMRHVKLRPGVSVDRPALHTLVTAAYQDIVRRS